MNILKRYCFFSQVAVFAILFSGCSLQPKTPPVLQNGKSAVLNLENYGATLGDTTDDTQAVRDAVAVAASLSRSSTIFVNGLVMISDTIVIPPNTSIRFVGSGTGFGEGTNEPGFKWIGGYSSPVSSKLSFSRFEITRNSGSFLQEGFRKGQKLFVTGTTLNNNEYLIYTVSHNKITIWRSGPAIPENTVLTTMSHDKSMFRLVNSNGTTFERLGFIGSSSNPPMAFIEATFDSDQLQGYTGSDWLRVYDTRMGPDMQRGIFLTNEKNEGDNDSYRIENSSIFKFYRAGVEIQNAQSIWGVISNTIFDGRVESPDFPPYGIITRADTTVHNCGFNRVKVGVKVLKKNTVRLWNPQCEHTQRLIETTEGAAVIDIRGGKCLLSANTQPTNPGSHYFIDSTAELTVIDNLKIYSTWTAKPRLRFRGNGRLEFRGSDFFDLSNIDFSPDLSVRFNHQVIP